MEYHPFENSHLLSFEHSARYRDLRQGTPAAACRESARAHAFPFTERHLQCVWFDALFRPPLLEATTGETITVKDPGRWNLEAGPDFLDAVLLVEPGTRLRCGDVEVHVRPADWDRHGHTGQPAYDRLAAHVTYFAGPRPAARMRHGVLHLPLQGPLEANPRFSFNAIDAAAYPHAVPADPVPPCAAAVESFPVADRMALLDAAGQERLRIKALRMQYGFGRKGPDQVLYEDVFAALGYKHNRLPFRRLAAQVPLDALQRAAGDDTTKAYALLLGVAGLLPSRPHAGRYDAETRRFIRTLWDHWWKLQEQWDDPEREKPGWRLSGLRPQNHPSRRLAAGAALFRAGSRVTERILALDPRQPRAWYASVRSLVAGSARLPYWSHRLGFRQPARPRPVALLGERRLAALIANAVIPFVAAHEIDVAPLLQGMPSESDNVVLRHMSERLFGRDHNPALHRHGIHQQGLIQIYHDFCLSAKNGCDECRLPEALRASRH